MAFFRIIPNITIMAPKDFEELHQMMDFACFLKKPVVIRYPKGGEDEIKFKKHSKIFLGQAEKLKDGNDVTIIAIGKMVARALKIAQNLKKEDIHAEVINARFLKPFDTNYVIKSIKKTKFIVTIEDGTLVGGLGTTVKELLVDNIIKNVKIKSFGYPDKFIKHGSVQELEEIYGLDEKNIESYIRYNYNKKITKNVEKK